MSPRSLWLAYLSPDDVADHQAWIRRGYQGSGRIVLENINLRRAALAAPSLMAARFVKCDLTEALIRHGDLTDIELIDCIWDDGYLEMSVFDRAIIENCQFVGARLKITDFIGAEVRGGNWNQADINRSNWKDAKVYNVSFQEACFREARLYNARFRRCDFNQADFNAAAPYDSVFEECNFRNANLEGMKLKGTVFYKCGFHNCKGTPVREGEWEAIEPDLSAEFDGSGVVDAQKLFEIWGLQKSAFSSSTESHF